MLTRDEIWILRLFRPDTGRVDLRPSKSRDELIRKGLIEWTPAPAWEVFSTYALTERGRAVMGVPAEGAGLISCEDTREATELKGSTESAFGPRSKGQDRPK